MFNNAYKEKSAFVTGHTGFKGSWLCRWLFRLGAKVHGYALDPLEHETLFSKIGIANCLTSDTRDDIRCFERLLRAIDRARPSIIFHLAAQPLVRLSYDIPKETFETNVMGTLNVLEAVRILRHPCAVVVVTTDKCYENREWIHAYREEDALGGYDPYSSSKACAELVTAAYRRSYFNGFQTQRVASARAGNVIGGGDWAVDRIVPDIFRALENSSSILVRNRHSTRPWQHVLEPVSGYLWLGAKLLAQTDSLATDVESFCTSFNFGPSVEGNQSVQALVEEFKKHVNIAWEDKTDPMARHEASLLSLSTDKAFHLLGWRPVWSFGETVRETAEWYCKVKGGIDAIEFTESQIEKFESVAMGKGISWACL